MSLQLQVDVVLISHLDVAHLGALPWLIGQHNLAVPVLARCPYSAWADWQ